jgi:hypothetical protein
MAFAAAMAMSASAVVVVRTGRVSTNDPPASGDVVVDETWVRTNEYHLNGLIFVQSGATLNVESGTLIRGYKDGSGGRPGALIVTRGSKINMLGTKNQPIVMTTTNGDNHYVGQTPTAGTAPWSDQNNGRTALWGGLLVLGRTYIADGSSPPNSSYYKNIEGTLPYGDLTRYGGGDDDDDSGTIRYVSIRYGGFVLAEANEINGLTMGALGRGTTIEHVEVFQNKDDGFEWFGGTVNTKYLVNWCNGDDSFDWDEGFRGKGQFWLTVQGPLSGGPDVSDKGAEMDGATTGDGRQPSSIGTVYNATYVGLGANLKNAALHFRDGSGGRYYNSLFLNFGGACALIEGLPTQSSHNSAKMTGYDYANTKPSGTSTPVNNDGSGISGYIGYDHATGGKMLEIQKCVFWNMGYTNAFGCATNDTNIAGPYGAEHDGDKKLDGFKGHYGGTNGYNLYTASMSNTYISAAQDADGPTLAFVRAADPVSINSVNYYPMEAFNPNLVTNSTYLSGGKSVPADGFYADVSFIGAFDNRKNWATWTVAAKKGLIEYETWADQSDFHNPDIDSEHLTYTVKWTATDSTATYKVWHTETLGGSWTPLYSVTGVTGEQTYTDTRELAGSGFYKVTD